MLCASSGEEALEIVRTAALNNRRIDLMLLDINMPRIDGFEVLQQLLDDSIAQKPSVVMCSTSKYDKDIERAAALGAAGYVEKPPQIEKLRALINSGSRLRLSEDETGCSLLRVA